MKKIVKSVLPSFVFSMVRHIVRYFRLGRSYFYDFNHYYRYSMAVDNSDESKLISQIIMDTHVIEKGLSMPETRYGFGVERLTKLMGDIITFENIYGLSDCQAKHGVAVINEYFKHHDLAGYELDISLLKLYEYFYSHLSEKESLKSQNTKEIDRGEVFSNVDSSFFEFSDSRSSIRSYSDEKIAHDTLIEILDHCRNTPSACNRQSVRVHLYEDGEQIQRILKVQGGNRGFGHLAQFAIAITFEPSKYFEQQERNLGYVDGGMYAMNMLYSLHAKKIAACILNASHSPLKDIAMRRETDVPCSEVFVAFIIGGYPSETIKIAQSFRYPLESVSTVH